jgi:molecular chaperone DnaJ
MLQAGERASYYNTLRVHYQAPQSEIKRAYRNLVKQFHPDCNHDLSNHDQIAAINIAYEVLSNPQSRATYDRSVGIQPASAKTEPKKRSERSPGLDEDARIDQWLRDVYNPISKILSKTLDELDEQIEELAADPFDDELLDNFQDYLEECRGSFNRAQTLFRGMPNPPSAAGVAAYLYHCLNQVGDGIEELNYFTLNFDDRHLHTGQELWRIADEMRGYAHQAVQTLVG